MKKQGNLERIQLGGEVASISLLPARDGFPVRTLDARDLFGNDVEVGIVHREALYRLRITRTGKLILNK